MTAAARPIITSRSKIPIAADRGRLRPLAGLGLALGAMGVSAATQTITILLLRFLTDSIAVAAATAAAIYALAQFYDAAIDPAVGLASDRTRTRWGRRRPYLMAGTVLLPLSIVLLFNMPATLSAGTLLIYVTLLLIIQATAGSIYKVPYAAIAVELCDDYHERSRMMAWRVGGNSIGLMLGSTIPSWALAHWGADRASYGDMAWLIAAVVFLSCLGGTLLLPEDQRVPSARPRLSAREYIALAWDNRPFRIICLAHACFLIGVATVSSSNAYFTRHVLQSSDAWLGTFYIIMIVATLAAIPLWIKVSRIFDKKATYIAALALYSLLHLSWLAADAQESIVLRSLRVMLIGVALSGVMLLAYSMIADAIRYDALRTGLRREGALSGIQSLVDKAFGVVGIASMGLLMSALGYAVSDGSTIGVQPSSAITAIYISFSITPAVTGFAAIAILSLYRIPREVSESRPATTGDATDASSAAQDEKA
ncbi:MFS transporter [Povalibacter sp.]|uniref:MFS transporter n=1 Tax=Povalibacter sp. TaxID=1962978 RepID=UPI002F3E1E9C